MNPSIRKIIINPHVATSACTFVVVVLVNVFNVPAEKANIVVGSLVGLMLTIDAVLAGTAESTVPGVATTTTTTVKAVEVPASDAAAQGQPKP